jgi:hypothetical protein
MSGLSRVTRDGDGRTYSPGSSEWSPVYSRRAVADVTALVLVLLAGVWAIVTGVLEIVAACGCAVS